MKLRVVDNFLPKGEFFHIREHLIDKPDVPFNYYDGKVYGRLQDNGLSDHHMVHCFYHWNRFPKEPTGTPQMGLMLPIIGRCRVLAVHRIKCNLELYSGPEHYESEYHKDWTRESTTEGSPTMQAAIYYVNSNNGYTEFAESQDGPAVEKVESVENRMVFFPADTWHRGVSSTNTKYRCVINFNWFTWSNYYDFDQEYDTYY